MSDDEAIDTTAVEPVQRRSSRRRRVVWVVLLLVGLALLVSWLNREDIADNLIASTLNSNGVEANYEVERVGGRLQVLRNIVVGDPQQPDLTIERAEIEIRYSFGLPSIGRVRIVRPRLFGTYFGGKPSFGALDPLIFPDSDEPFEFPDYALELVDGRALFESDYGPIGIKAEGSGHLRGGFNGTLAATAPDLSAGGCTANGTTLYGAIGIKAERPTFKGPLRLKGLRCNDGAVALGDTGLVADLQLDRDLAGVEAGLKGEVKAATVAGVAARVLTLESKATFRDKKLTASYEIGGQRLSHPQAQLAEIESSGMVRTGEKSAWLRVEGEFKGRGLRAGAGLDQSIAAAADGAKGTFLEALLRQVRTGLRRETAGSTLSGQFDMRQSDGALTVVMPRAQVTATSGQRLLSLTRFQYGSTANGLPRLTGNFATGGQGLPRVEGRVERVGTTGTTARISMAPFGSDRGRLVIPGISIVAKGRTIGFSGRVLASGDLRGSSRAKDLDLPLVGNWSEAGGLTLGRECTLVRFDSFQVAGLRLDRRGVTLCPIRASAIVRLNGAGLKVAATIAALDLGGRLGSSPVAISSDSISLTYPGRLSAKKVHVALGPRDATTTFDVDELSADFDATLGGRFAGGDLRLAAVPLNLVQAGGNWNYVAGVLNIGDGSFRLVDRKAEARFEPLVADGARITLKDGAVVALARLQEPASRRVIASVSIHHDLGTGIGYSDLEVPGLVFDRGLQPAGLSKQLLGVLANVDGTVTGLGRIDWNADKVTSTGRFSTRSLDFAAAFGPVKGASGTVEFTDLIGLTTAPDQRFKVAAINPGIEVYDGEIGIEYRNGSVLAVTGGTWPFMGGTLKLRPVSLNIGASEERAYTLDIIGLEASQFVQRMELSNISASGKFDGSMPLIFDAAGNGRIEHGELYSRGGGNLSYVGALTYEDMGAVANFAFDALRSLDYEAMTVSVNGPLTGELVTQVRFEGVKQGAGAKKNLITREIAKLPIRFVVNIRASFYELMTNLRSLYDPSAVKDPRDLEVGLLDSNGRVIRPLTQYPPGAPAVPIDRNSSEPPIQRRESEDLP